MVVLTCDSITLSVDTPLVEGLALGNSPLDLDFWEDGNFLSLDSVGICAGSSFRDSGPTTV